MNNKTKRKNHAIQMLLSLILGPFGLLYSGGGYCLVAIIMNAIFYFTLDLAIFWMIFYNIVVGIVGVSKYNKQLRG